jgi:ubiquinone/menaquinone biosynthesis C-methylase UbiE
MKLREEAASIRRLIGPGIYPSQFAGLLLSPLRRLILSPEALADRLHLAETAVVLEVGSGPGYFSGAVARRLPRGHLELLDVQPEMLERARARLDRAGLRNVGFTLADAARLPFDDETFDVAFLVTVLGEVVDRVTVLGELGRALCPAGWLSITEQAGDPDRLSLTALQAEVEQAGFELSETYRGRLSYTANFRKGAAGS